jgi:MFS family permease
MEAEAEYQAYGYRWVVLSVYAAVLFIGGFLWLTFVPIETEVQRVLGVSAFQVRLLGLVGLFVSILLAPLAGSISDNSGFRFSVFIGLLITVVSGVVRAIIPHLTSSGHIQYWVYFFMQMLGGAGGIFVLVNLSKMPIKWFPEDQRATATGLAMVSALLGNGVALPIVVAVANIPEHAGKAVIQAGLNRVLTFTALLPIVAGVLFLIFAREEPPTPSGPFPEEIKVRLRESMPKLLRSSTFLAIGFVSLIGYGVFQALTLTIEKVITFHGPEFTKNFASLVAMSITIGGIVGLIVLTQLSDRIGRRKPFLLAAAIVVIPCLVLIGIVSNKALNLVGAIIMGFFLLAALPISYTAVGELEEIGPMLAGTAVGVLTSIGDIGSVVIPALMEAVAIKKTAEVIDYRWAIFMFACLGVVALLGVVFWVKETGPKGRSEI